MKSFIHVLAAFTIVVAASSCGSRDPQPPLYAISGRITYQGKPLETGKVVFIPTEVGGGKAYYAQIQNGEFRGEATAGEKNVQIISERPTGEVIKGDRGEEFIVTESVLPKQYGEFSKIMFTVETHPNNELVLDLE
jgi:hypothetical protein